MARRPVASALAFLLIGLPLLAQDNPRQDAFTERVEVNVRTVLAVVTDAKGARVQRPLSVEEVEVLEDGVAAKVLGVDLVGTAKTAPAIAPAAPTPPGTLAEAQEVPTRVPQILYVDASLLQKKSVKKVCEMASRNLAAVLARGPIEIVIADPEPREVLPAVSDAAAARAALEALAKTGQGRDRLFDVRSDFIGATAIKSKGPELDALNRRMRARAAMQEEVQLVRQSLERLERWAGQRAAAGPAVLYMANDGFDIVVTDFYRNYLNSPRGDQSDAEQLRMEFEPQIPALVAKTEEALASRGLMTVPVAIGGSEAFFTTSASTMGKRSESDLRNPVGDAPTFLFIRPLDPLREIAAATGGEVVTREDHFVQAIDRLSGVVAITYRMNRPPDGRIHRLEVKAKRSGVTLRAAQSVLDAPELVASARSAVQALAPDAEAPPGPGALAVVIHADLMEVKPDKRRVGEVRVSADLTPIVEALERVGPGRMRVTLAVRAVGMKPFVYHEEVDLARSGGGAYWSYVFPLEWPPEATRISIAIEEIKTGTRGAAAVDLPSPDGDRAPGSPEAVGLKPDEFPLRATLLGVARRGGSVSATIHATADATNVLERLAGKSERVNFTSSRACPGPRGSSFATPRALPRPTRTRGRGTFP